MAMGDCFELKHKWRDNDGRECENVYFYQLSAVRGLGIETDEEALAVAWIDAVLTPMNATIPNSYVTSAVEVRNLFNAEYTWNQPMSLVGGRSGAGAELMPQFNSAKATLAHNSGLVKKARKMFGGMFETDQINGLLTAAGYSVFAVRAALTVLWVADSVLSGEKSYRPVVIKRIRVEDSFTGKVTYRLPETLAETILAPITSAVVSLVVTSQDTRKA